MNYSVISICGGSGVEITNLFFAYQLAKLLRKIPARRYLHCNYFYKIKLSNKILN